ETSPVPYYLQTADSRPRQDRSRARRARDSRSGIGVRVSVGGSPGLTFYHLRRHKREPELEQHAGGGLPDSNAEQSDKRFVAYHRPPLRHRSPDAVGGPGAVGEQPVLSGSDRRVDPL